MIIVYIVDIEKEILFKTRHIPIEISNAFVTVNTNVVAKDTTCNLNVTTSDNCDNSTNCTKTSSANFNVNLTVAESDKENLSKSTNKNNFNTVQMIPNRKTKGRPKGSVLTAIGTRRKNSNSIKGSSLPNLKKKITIHHQLRCRKNLMGSKNIRKLLRLRNVTLYHRAVRRKANLKVTGEEKRKTRLRRRTANKRLCRGKKPVCALPDEEKSVSLVSNEKKPVCAVLGRKISTNDISARKKNRNLLAKILLILLISRTRNLESIY